jgi:D-tagatose-1,6-bisphosphate aldolase subunit GatZ/KbaZ
MIANSDRVLDQVVAAQKQGRARGIASICSANEAVLETCIVQAVHDGSVLLVESTCNQVNQEGGYTGLTPSQFRERLRLMARRHGLPMQRVLVGGDHLGPNPWKHEPSETAMLKARRLVRDCVETGYQKIHLDASMRCADDNRNRPLPGEVAAARAAALCQAAERAAAAREPGTAGPWYVIGTEVPVPGGVAAGEDDLAVTRVQDARNTVELTRRAFLARDLHGAWERVIALVVQPGVEFGDASIHAYEPQAAAALSAFIERYDRLVFEVHSTDYQTREALRHLVHDHFAILKVGPALTFAYREALFALAMMEEEWLGSDASTERSNLIPLVDRVMLDHPRHWQAYYQGDERYLGFARRYSYSDRVRYYWPSPLLQKAIARLIENFEQHPAPYSLLSQYLPVQYERLRAGQLANRPQDLIRDKIASVLADYVYATGNERNRPNDPS